MDRASTDAVKLLMKACRIPTYTAAKIYRQSLRYTFWPTREFPSHVQLIKYQSISVDEKTSKGITVKISAHTLLTGPMTTYAWASALNGLSNEY